MCNKCALKWTHDAHREDPSGASQYFMQTSHVNRRQKLFMIMPDRCCCFFIKVMGESTPPKNNRHRATCLGSVSKESHNFATSTFSKRINQRDEWPTILIHHNAEPLLKHTWEYPTTCTVPTNILINTTHQTRHPPWRGTVGSGANKSELVS